MNLSLFETIKKKSPILMGILNITPDSFSDGGLFIDQEQAINAASEMISSGATIVDIGGESTRPGAKIIDGDIELKRIKNVVRKLSASSFLSIDTFRSSTAQECLQSGAKMINDVSALRYDSSMGAVIKEHDAYVSLMYSKENDSHPYATKKAFQYDDCIKTIIDFLADRIDHCLSLGISSDKIIIDPGMGAFVSTDPKYSWEIIKDLKRIKTAFKDFPILVGISRKGFLGGELESRDCPSQVASVIAAQNGASIIRTHNVEMAQQCFEVLDKIQ